MQLNQGGQNLKSEGERTRAQVPSYNDVLPGQIHKAGFTLGF